MKAARRYSKTERRKLARWIMLRQICRAFKLGDKRFKLGGKR
jgi:hypothetical protein